MGVFQKQKEKEFLEEFEKKHIFKKGHFELNSGKHSNVYIDKEALFLDADLRSRLCDMLCLDLISAEIISSIEGIVAPGKGGIVYADTLSRKLSLMTGRTIAGIFAEKEEKDDFDYYVPKKGPEVQKIFVRLNSFRFRKAFEEIIQHKKFLAIDDVITTGGSLKRVVDAVRLLGGIVEYAGCIWNRGAVQADSFIAKKFFPVIEKQLSDWKPSDCPQCKVGIALTSSK